MSPPAAQGASQAVDHAARHPSPTTPQKTSRGQCLLELLWSWIACTHSAGLPLCCLREWKFFLGLNPHLPPRHAQKYPQIPITHPSSPFLFTPPPPFSHKLRGPKDKQVYLQNTYTLSPSMHCLESGWGQGLTNLRPRSTCRGGAWVRLEGHHTIPTGEWGWIGSTTSPWS